MRDHKIWRDELISEVRTIADATELKRLWTGADPGAASSFVEEVTHVFNDYDIDGFIAAGEAQSKLRPDQFDALREFRDRFATYVHGLSPIPLESFRHEDILESPEWREVTMSAHNFVALLDSNSDGG